jgi:C4-dicarboxylate-specific signal transduction histidine kinase
MYCIILSGTMMKENVLEALHRGAHDVLEKPYDLSLIRSRLEVAAHITRERKASEEMARVMQRYGEQMEQLAQERAQQLVHADRMSSLGVMAAGIAHEINNPMSFISGNAQSVQRYWSDIEPILRTYLNEQKGDGHKIEFILTEMPKVLASIMNGVQRVTTIVKGLKKYSGKTTKESRDSIDLNHCIEQALELCKGNFDKSLVVERKLTITLPLVSANSLEIEQVLVNLLVNASHAMAGKETQILTISSQKTTSAVLVAVEDTGTGIPATLLTKIWDPFVTTKAIGQGTGLGLSISSGIIKSHGGELKASNRPQGGARFELSLPLQNEEPRK